MLIDLPLSRTALDRAGHLRADQAELDRLWASGRIIELIGDRFLTSGNALSYASPTTEGERYFLGLDGDGRLTQSIDQLAEVLAIRLLASAIFLTQPLSQQPPDSQAEHKIGKNIPS